MGWADILGTLFSAGSAAAGSQGGGSTGGILSALGSIFGDQTPSGYSPGLSTTLNVLGNLANQFKATPNEGATEEDVKKANRYNMLSGILGGIASGAGQYMDTQAKQESLGALSDILSGRTTTTGQAIFPSRIAEPATTQQRLAQWTKENPQLAEFGVKLQLEQAVRDQELLKEQYKAAQKAGGSIPSYGSALNIMTMLGLPVGQRDEGARAYIADETRKKQEAVKNALAGIGGIQSGPAMGVGASVPLDSQVSPQRQVLDEAIKQGQATGGPIEGTFPAGTSMGDVVKALEGAGYQESTQPAGKEVYGAPAWVQMAQAAADKIEQEKQEAKRIEQERYQTSEARRNRQEERLNKQFQLSEKTQQTQEERYKTEQAYRTRQEERQNKQFALNETKQLTEQKRYETQLERLNRQEERLNQELELRKNEQLTKREREKTDQEYRDARLKIEKEKVKLSYKKDYTTPFESVIKRGNEAATDFAIIKKDLESDDPAVQSNGVAKYIALRDGSVVQIGEYDRFVENVFTKQQGLIKTLNSYLDAKTLIPKSVVDKLIKSAEYIKQTQINARNAATKAIDLAADKRAKGDSFASPNEYYDQLFQQTMGGNSGVGNLDAQVQRIQQQLGPNAKFLGVR